MRPVEIRKETDPPTEEGWYYACWIDEGTSNMKVVGIQPVMVGAVRGRDGLYVFTMGADDIPVETVFFKFFGPVTEVREEK